MGSLLFGSVWESPDISLDDRQCRTVGQGFPPHPPLRSIGSPPCNFLTSTFVLFDVDIVDIADRSSSSHAGWLPEKTAK